MTEFATEISDRIRAAQESLAEARKSDDDYLVGVRTGELESLARMASEHGIDVPELEEGFRLPQQSAGPDLDNISPSA